MQNTESLFATLKSAETNLLSEIQTQSTLLSDLNQELDKIRKMMDILGNQQTPASSSEKSVASKKSRVQQGLAKRQAVKTVNKDKGQEGKKLTIQDQIVDALHEIKFGTKERIINYLLRDKEPLPDKEMKKLKHNITVVASNMFGDKKLAIKGKEKRSYIYTLPKAERSKVQQQAA